MDLRSWVNLYQRKNRCREEILKTTPLLKQSCKIWEWGTLKIFSLERINSYLDSKIKDGRFKLCKKIPSIEAKKIIRNYFHIIISQSRMQLLPAKRPMKKEKRTKNSKLKFHSPFQRIKLLWIGLKKCYRGTKIVW